MYIDCLLQMPLPQLGLEDPERVCEYCRPVTEFITKSWSPHQVRLQVLYLWMISNLQLNDIPKI